MWVENFPKPQAKLECLRTYCVLQCMSLISCAICSNVAFVGMECVTMLGIMPLWQPKSGATTVPQRLGRVSGGTQCCFLLPHDKL